MKNATQAVKDFIATATNIVWRADLVTITLRDGSVYRWSVSDRDLVVGGYTYTAGPVVSRSYRQSSRLEVDTFSLVVAGAFQFGSTSLATALLRGTFDDARIEIDHLVGAHPGDLTKAPFALFVGRISGVDPDPITARIECKSDLEELSNIQLPRFTFRAQCGNAVYDANCGLTKATWTETGFHVQSGATTSAFSSLDFNIAKQDHYYNLGVVAFTSGALNGVRRAVKEYTQSTKTVTLSMPLPQAPAAGDTFSIYPGCSRSWTTCSAVFSNTARFRGFRHIPTSEGGL